VGLHITITTRLVDKRQHPDAAQKPAVARDRPEAADYAATFTLDRILYETFAHAADTHALKVIIEA
jgi:alcohol dehydrogenase